MHLRLVTYNIHKGIGGRDRRYRPERIIETLAHLQPDIAFLQEVDEGVPRSRHDMQAELLASGLGLKHFAFQRNVNVKKGWYGNAILSRFPLTDIESYDLTVRFKKRRQALLARCKVPVGEHTRSLIMTNLHLGLAGPERVFQLRKFLAHHLVADAQRQTPIIVGGDFNDVWGSLGKKVLEPVGFELAGGMIRTFPALLPMRPLDRVYFRGPLQVHHSFACRTRLAHQASDHLPLVAEFVWKE
jgi:endonuclease/exonuclease/phosphatase family metal-dependent hydrolase